jgi:hypothetical protein
MESTPDNAKKIGVVEAYFTSRLAVFLPLVAVFLALSAAYMLQVKGSLEQRRQLKAQLAEFEKDLPRIQLVNSKMLELSRDLVNLGRGDPLAQQIVREFNIRIDQGGEKKESGPS